MGSDPLSFFALTKTALGGAGDVSARGDGGKLDPGERALAGIATQSSAYAVALPYAGGEVLRYFGNRGSLPWGHVEPLKGVKSKGPPVTTPGNAGRFMGLFDISGRAKEAPDEAYLKVEHKLNEIGGVVDSFFQKHELGEKGVTLNFRSGPLTKAFGPHYDLDTRKVFLPRVSKELVLHELGHAADYTSSALGKLRAIGEPTLRRAALTVLPIALIAGDEIAQALPGTIDDRAIHFMQDHAPSIMAATLAATSLYPEAKASLLALKHIKDVEGGAAAAASFKKLLPLWGSYLIRAIPPVVGMALARKYMREARQENEKTASALGEALGPLKDAALDLGHVARQIGHGVVQLAKDPDVGRRIARAAREVGTSPEFVTGALSSAIPATAGALYLYATEPGRVLRQQIHNVGRSTKEIFNTRPRDEAWRERHPAVFAGLVGLGAAMSAGVLHKMINDLQGVL
jgi:hypothetical protein